MVQFDAMTKEQGFCDVIYRKCDQEHRIEKMTGLRRKRLQACRQRADLVAAARKDIELWRSNFYCIDRTDKFHYCFNGIDHFNIRYLEPMNQNQ